MNSRAKEPPCAEPVGVYPESDLIPLSALQHYLVCPRQCALIHVEQQWAENRLTAEGRLQHERVDDGGWEKRRGVKRVFSLQLRSLRLGLVGKADVVEFHRGGDGQWTPYPVEHKRGRRKRENWDRVQLCAQALCLEEMLGAVVPEGALFYGKERRREVVALDAGLRAETEAAASAVHTLLADGRTPPAEYAKKCERCSLVGLCLPRKTGARSRSVARYLEGVLDGG
jgi:CRISPR-associated exonuclease Cas4